MRTHLIALTCLLALLGCAAEPEPPLPPEHPRRLLETFEAFAQGLAADPRPEKARAFLEGFALTKPQMIALFGPEKGQAAWKGYTETILPALRAEAGEVLVREITQEKRTEAWVEPVGPAWPSVTTRGDQAILDALAQKRPVYTARLRRPGEVLGLRLSGFVHLDGEWKALFKVYEHL